MQVNKKGGDKRSVWSAPFRLWINSFASLGRHVGRSHSFLMGGLRRLRGKSREQLSQERIESMKQDFFWVQHYWGFKEVDIPRILRGLKIEMLGMSFFVIVGLVLLFHGVWHGSWIYIFCGFVPMYLGGLKILVGFYRYRVIARRQFLPFGEWLGTDIHQRFVQWMDRILP